MTSMAVTGIFEMYASALEIKWMGGTTQFVCPSQHCVKASTPADRAVKKP